MSKNKTLIMKKNLLFLVTIFAFNFLQAQETLVAVFEEPMIQKLNPIFFDLELGKGDAKSITPITLPENCKGWYYTITVTGKNKSIKEEPYLLAALNQFKEQSNLPTARLVNQVNVKRTARVSNIYIIDGHEDAQSFLNYQHYTYLKKFCNTKSRVGYVENDNKKDYFIGIENPYELKGLKVKIEVVALVDKE